MNHSYYMKKICLYNKQTHDCVRVTIQESNNYLAAGYWFTSKGKFKRLNKK